MVPLSSKGKQPKTESSGVAVVVIYLPGRKGGFALELDEIPPKGAPFQGACKRYVAALTRSQCALERCLEARFRTERSQGYSLCERTILNR